MDERRTQPRAIKDASGLKRLVASLRAHGFGEQTMRNLMLENWLRVFRLTWQ
jgi:microsomal dipeptidase-like Zn-dependent dipeptidase